MNELRDTPGVIAPPPLIALAPITFACFGLFIVKEIGPTKTEKPVRANVPSIASPCRPHLLGRLRDVKAYVKRNKDDAADAAAICEAVRRPTMRFVEVKSAEQQGPLMQHRTRHKRPD